MNSRYFLYALFVTVLATWTSWAKMFDSSGNRGSSAWRSSGSGGWGGGSHK